MKKLFFVFVSSGLLSLTPFASFGQTDTILKKNEYHFWLNSGGKYFFSGNYRSLLGIQSGVNFSINQQHFIKLEGYAGVSTDWTLLSGSKSDRLSAIGNLSLLYGIGRYKTKSFAIVAYSGLSYGRAFWRGHYLYTEHRGWFGSDNPVYDDDKYNYIGLPIEINFILTTSIIGTSLGIYANAHKHPDYGLTISWLLGKIRDKKNKT
jgi:hypothetical protein